jgi:hypothetical protein
MNPFLKGREASWGEILNMPPRPFKIQSVTLPTNEWEAGLSLEYRVSLTLGQHEWLIAPTSPSL